MQLQIDKLATRQLRGHRRSSVASLHSSGCSGEFKPTKVAVPELGEGQVLVKVEVCGVCGGDHGIKDGAVPGAVWPRIPGHEVVGTVVALGPGAKRWKVGDRVGRGWAGGHCFSWSDIAENRECFCEFSVAELIFSVMLALPHVSQQKLPQRTVLVL
jgi:D-arabinose 1-dehydrogenase-like Zn-dependent alcohol dehydrogenase